MNEEDRMEIIDKYNNSLIKLDENIVNALHQQREM